jgi:hyperosmotically inducible protein
MLKRNMLVVLTVGLLLTPAIAALSQEDTTPSPADAEISARVKGLLIRNEEVKANQVNVETERGVVQLSGFVDSEQAKEAATETARSVVGVTEVRNELIVRQGDRTASSATDDTLIEAKVKSELATNAGLAPATKVKVEVQNGVVQLSGFVTSDDQKHQAERIARQVAGVTEVRNDIAIEPLPGR